MKIMATTMVTCAERLIRECEELASTSKSGEVEVEFSRHFQELTAEVISRTAFGSSYKEGKEVFHTQQQLLALALATLLNLQLPGFKQVILLFFFGSAVTVRFLHRHAYGLLMKSSCSGIFLLKTTD